MFFQLQSQYLKINILDTVKVSFVTVAIDGRVEGSWKNRAGRGTKKTETQRAQKLIVAQKRSTVILF